MNNTEKNTSSKNRFGFVTRGLKTKLVLSLSVNTFAVLTVIFFSPLEVFLGNINQFWFSFGDIWWILALVSAGIIAGITALECLMPLKATVVSNLFFLGIGLCCYVQSSFLNGRMGTLTGEIDVYSDEIVTWNIVIWLALFAAVFISYFITARFCKKGIAANAVRFLSLALVAMQTTALIAGILTSDSKTSSDKNFYLSNKGEFELSKSGNVVVFIVDTCDSRYFEEMLDTYPDLMNDYDGFTYYDNATSTHSRTYPSLPYLLTNEMCYFDTSFNDYIDSAYNKSTFLQDVASNGTDIGLYTDIQYLGKSADKYVSNAICGPDISINFGEFMKQMGRVALYRDLPYAVKQRFKYGSVTVNYKSLDIADICIANDDLRYYEKLTENGLTVSDNDNSSFRFYHMWGAHPGAKFNEKLEKSVCSSPIESGAADFRIIAEYIREMKKNGVYENSTIIITADHGSSSGSSDDNPLVISGAPRVVMLTKPAGIGNNTPDTSDDTYYTISDAPVCHADLFATIINAAGGDSTKYGKTIFDYSEDEERTRYYYNSALYTDEDGEVALREYEITGNSKDFANWKLTGRNWDINFSERAVSRHRLSEVLDK